ncbi:FFLEELY motif protein [Piscinibacter sp.]|uniref:FFLEELY motif protein n=1 Tax=Piscinibacter sp. TaxID=1903157 RepID=UPI002F40F85A
MSDANSILGHLRAVAGERQRRAESLDLEACVRALKSYQQQRFARTYADLLATTRYGAASRFFLEELYGPTDFAERDAQFARVVPALVRLFPQDIVATVNALAQLHALSEALDSAMATQLAARTVDRAAYVAAWQATAHPELREQQIALTVSVGEALDRLTRNPLVRHSLHMMRGPSRAAGLGELQRFLETGFDTFKAMRGAQEFLATVGTRERALASSLFSANLQDAVDEGRLCDTPLGQLP